MCSRIVPQLHLNSSFFFLLTYSTNFQIPNNSESCSTHPPKRKRAQVSAVDFLYIKKAISVVTVSTAHINMLQSHFRYVFEQFQILCLASTVERLLDEYQPSLLQSYLLKGWVMSFNGQAHWLGVGDFLKATWTTRYLVPASRKHALCCTNS